MEEKKRLEDCYRQMYLGMIAKDRAALSRVLDDSFVLVHMTGMRQDKESYIRAIENGTLNYYSADHERFEIEAMTETEAEAIGQSRVNAAVFGGGRHTWKLQLRMRLIRCGSEWKIATAEASTY